MESVKIEQFVRISGSGYGLKIETYKNEQVYYVDGIPCVFQSLKEDYALVEVIGVNDLRPKKMYIAKRHGVFAHRNTLKEAIEDAETKWLESQTVEEKIEQFKLEFKQGVQYPTELLYNWHTRLTGSCKAGKDQWLSQNGIDLKSTMTVAKFIQLTRNAYGGEIIRRLEE